MGQITVNPGSKKAELKKGRTILSYIQELGIHINASCGGLGICKGCLVRITGAEYLNQQSEIECESIKTPDKRLACQAKVINEDGNITVEVPTIAKYKILEKGISKNIPFDPMVRLKKSPSGEKVYWQNIEIGEYQDEIYGIALDVGTTTVSMYWVDLETGQEHLVSSILNPQIGYGDNIIDRIKYTMVSNQSHLEKAVREGVNEMIRRGPIDPSHIYEMVVVGNTAMRDIFIGHSVKKLGQAPYDPVSRDAVNRKGQELDLEINPKANVYALSLIGHFVGADALGVVLSTEMYKNHKITMAIDIGTNTEIVMGNRDKLLATSCASGPAFEGYGIKCGTGAIEGAIQEIEIGDDLKATYKTIGDKQAIGICGSGIIDLLAQMLDKEIIDWRGKFLKGEREYLVTIGANGDRIFLDGRDIDNLKLAKSAIAVGIKVLMRKYGIDLNDIKELYLAGAFGNYINTVNAIRVGMLPDISLERIVKVGNAAIEGARQALISKDKRAEAEKISKNIEHISLESEKDFQERFVEELSFNRYRIG
jgi:uncharacterized 2Fe-2S/4Fe-4S cluster protein (DUF4445 family)